MTTAKEIIEDACAVVFASTRSAPPNLIWSDDGEEWLARRPSAMHPGLTIKACRGGFALNAPQPDIMSAIRDVARGV